VNLQPGVNTLSLPKAHAKYQLKLSKWGIQDEMTFTKEQVSEGTVIGLGGNKAAKKLRLEEKFLLVEGAFRPEGKSVFYYHTNGSLKQVAYYQKKPHASELQKTLVDMYQYSGSNVSRIQRMDGAGQTVGFTAFTYNAQQTKVVNIHQKSYDQETYAAVSYAYPAGRAEVTIDYLYSNGNTMEYVQTIKGGNKVADAARTSTGDTERGTYTYDFNINPFAHMNMPNIYLSNISKNNLIGQEKGYGGNIPSGIPYHYEYSYDGEGYPITLLTSYKSFTTGEHLYKIKTVYSYQ
jgi:hypothetical protein